MTTRKLLAAVLFFAGVILLAGCATTRQAFPLIHGEPYHVSSVEADEIRHVPTGLRLTFPQAMDMIEGARLVCVGENHSSLHAHRVQLEVIRELHRRFPGKVAVGMEMFREPQQEALDRWVRGELSEKEFLKESRWYDNWGSDFGYYRDILAFARDNSIDIIALNPPKDLQQQVRMTPIDKLPEEVRAKLPEIDDSDPYARAMLKAIFAGHSASDSVFDAFFRVQQLWEESMAQRIVDYLRSPRGEGKKMVTVTGGGHVTYGYNIPKKVVRRLPLPYVIILPEEISIPEDRIEELTMDVDEPEIPLFKSDFVWWVPYEDLEEGRVRLGVGLLTVEGKVAVSQVEEGSSAEAAGIQVGDVILAFDGGQVGGRGDIIAGVNEKRAGDNAVLRIRREGTELDVTVTFLAPPEKEMPKK